MRVAVIEDEKKLVETLTEGLESEGYEVMPFFTGEAFIESLTQSERFDVIILDLGLPGMRGNEVSKYIRSHQILSPILILTAHDTIADKVEALDSGADDFLAKPFDFEELMARLRALVRRSTTQASAIRHEDLNIDMYARSVTRAGTSIELTPTELDLLFLLIQNRNRVLTREEISNALWNLRDPSLSNIVDVHISNLRKKIDGNYATKLISTIRGTGYKIT